MTKTKILFFATLVSLAASSSLACAVDGVSTITDTTIAISWDLSSCKHPSGTNTFKVCWKKQGNSGNACISPVLFGQGTSGTTTITGLSPASPYRIRTLWHNPLGWFDVTTRIVTTQADQGSSSYLLRYDKGAGQKYCVAFYWKGPALPAIWVMELHVEHWVLGRFTFDKSQSQVVTGSPYNTSTGEYSVTDCGFSNNQRYQAVIELSNPTTTSGLASNFVEWK
jgi:hypothetical protein